MKTEENINDYYNKFFDKLQFKSNFLFQIFFLQKSFTWKMLEMKIFPTKLYMPIQYRPTYLPTPTSSSYIN